MHQGTEQPVHPAQNLLFHVIPQSVVEEEQTGLLLLGEPDEGFPFRVELIAVTGGTGADADIPALTLPEVLDEYVERSDRLRREDPDRDRAGDP